MTLYTGENVLGRITQQLIITTKMDGTNTISSLLHEVINSTCIDGKQMK